jgi:uncharacterized RDD family membrane protein YckC
MFCPVCGNKLDIPPEKVSFCPFCGADIQKKRILPDASPGTPTARPSMPQSPMNPQPDNTYRPNAVPPISTAPPSENYGTPPPYPNQYPGGYAPQYPMGQPSGYGYNYNRMNTGPYATFGERFLAYLIDIIIIALISNFIIDQIFYNLIFADVMDTLTAFVEADIEAMSDAQFEALMNTLTLIYIRLIVYYSIIYFAYFFLFSWALKGRSPGKAIMKLQIVDPTTLDPITSPGRLLIDSITKFYVLIVFDVIIGAIANPRERKQYRITQKLAKTAVIKKPQTPFMPAPMPGPI